MKAEGRSRVHWRRVLTCGLCALLVACGASRASRVAPALGATAGLTPTAVVLPALGATAGQAPTAEATRPPAAVLADLGGAGAVALGLGETASLGPDGASVSFERVLEDSRCPANAQCLWQGRVVIAGSVIIDGQTQPFTLGTLKGFEDAPVSFSAGPYTLSIEEVEPYPETPEGIADEDYVLTLAVES